MMIFGMGVDVIEIDRIKKELEKYGDKLNGTLFTDEEVRYCIKGKSINRQAQCFAGRFTAKEAFLKALGTGLRDGIQWKDIEIKNDDLGAPSIHLKGKAKEVVDQNKIDNILLSISHSRTTAVSSVILER